MKGQLKGRLTQAALGPQSHAVAKRQCIPNINTRESAAALEVPSRPRPSPLAALAELGSGAERVSLSDEANVGSLPGQMPPPLQPQHTSSGSVPMGTTVMAVAGNGSANTNATTTVSNVPSPSPAPPSLPMPMLKRKSTTELIDVYLNDEGMESWDGDGQGSNGANPTTASTSTAAVAGASVDAPHVVESISGPNRAPVSRSRGARTTDALSD